jgi:hypothetical protein
MKPAILDKICSVALQPTFPASARQKRALMGMQECRTTRYGGRVVQCPTCGSIKTIYNSCNQRGCPICYKKNQKLWEQRVLRTLINTSHFHLVYSIPQAYTLVWLRYKKDFTDAFYECVKKSIGTIPKDYGVTPGCVAVFQSHGTGMVYKPHVHCALTAGGITATGEWSALGSISYKRLAKVVQANLYKELLKKKIPIKDLPIKQEIDQKEWSVYATYYQDNAEKIIGYLSHAAGGVVINLQQHFQENHAEGTISFVENHAGKQVRTELGKQTFVERYINHIPQPHTVTVRYYGLYSNRYGEQLEKLQEQFPLKIVEERELKDHCPYCHSEMDIIKILEPYEVAMTIEEFRERDPPEHYKKLTIIGSVRC